MERVVRIIGGGLAGCEAAWQLARRGVAVELFEMRPGRMTEAHTGGELAEVACSNSLRSLSLTSPAGSCRFAERRDASARLSGHPGRPRSSGPGGFGPGSGSRGLLPHALTH